MSFFRLAAFFGLVTLTLVAAVSAAHAQNTVGTIRQLQGVANIQRNGATTPAMVNEPIMLHDKIVTAPNASLTIGLVDISFLQLTSSSTLSLPERIFVNSLRYPPTSSP